MSRPGPAQRVIIAGPTATGKSAVAMAVAGLVSGVEIVNADSRQVIRDLVIGTAAPGASDRAQVRHHLYGIRDAGEEYTVAAWAAAAESVLTDIAGRGGHAIVVGGTGLYINALVDGLDPLPAPDKRRRAERTALGETAEGRAQLVAELLQRDPAAATLVEMRNPRRVIRALEILDTTEGGLGSVRTRRRREPGPGTLLVGVDLDRDEHRRRIAARTREMFESAAITREVADALSRGTPRDAIAASGIGYAEALDLIEGAIDAPAAIAATLQRTVRYVKAQRTFFRADTRIQWLDAGDGAGAAAESIIREARW